MTITLTDFIQQLFSNPVLFVTVILTLSVILVNGWTDAPMPLQPAYRPEP